MAQDDSAAEKSTEDIVERLEALRKKAPEGDSVEEKENRGFFILTISISPF